jgi:hypothetical protein
MDSANLQYAEKWHRELPGIILVHYIFIPLAIMVFFGIVGYCFYGISGALVLCLSAICCYLIGRNHNKYLLDF